MPAGVGWGELGGCGSSLRARGALDPRDVLRLHALSALGLLVGHLVALIEGFESFAHYATVVDEEVLARSSSVTVCWSWCCSAPHSGQKLAASSGSCAPQFWQDSSSCCSWVYSSVNALFSLAPGGPSRGADGHAPLLLARNT